MAVISSLGSFRSSFEPRGGREVQKKSIFFGEVKALESHSSGESVFQINGNLYTGNSFVINREVGVKRFKLSISPSELAKLEVGDSPSMLEVNWDVFVNLGRDVTLRASGKAKGVSVADDAANSFRFDRYSDRNITWFRATQHGSCLRKSSGKGRLIYSHDNRVPYESKREWVALVNDSEVVRFVNDEGAVWAIYSEISRSGIPAIKIASFVNLSKEEERNPLPVLAGVYFDMRQNLFGYFNDSNDNRLNFIIANNKSRLPIEIEVAGYFNAPEDMSLQSGDVVKLQREHDNPHDENAVAIYANFYKNQQAISIKIGFVPRAEAKVISLLIDSGVKLVSKIIRFGAGYSGAPIINIEEDV